MTTIAYRWGVLAADSRMMSGGWKHRYSATKLFRLPSGDIAGVVGTYAEAVAFVTWLQNSETGDKPALNEATVIRLRKDGSLTIYEQNASFNITTEFGAWGSGSPAANAAMYMGADAAKAVEIAALLDDCTGGEVVTMKCEI
jgi:ATP-dependent protease HslVU (ClpYQ) peptidase subunit